MNLNSRIMFAPVRIFGFDGELQVDVFERGEGDLEIGELELARERPSGRAWGCTRGRRTSGRSCDLVSERPRVTPMLSAIRSGAHPASS
jgi:hypothetical protein